MKQPQLTADQFGSMAARYLVSTVHASGADLERLVALARQLPPGGHALDVGCGAGHAAFALARAALARVVAVDLSPQMLAVVAAEAKVRGVEVETHVSPAHRLGFADGSFDLVVTRYSAHHWLDVAGALREMHRVLKPGATLVVIDVTAPETALDDTALQTLELLRDRSHVRDYRVSEWREFYRNAGFGEPTHEHWRLPVEFASWVARIGTSPPRIAALEVLIDELPSEPRSYFSIGDDRSFEIDAGWFQATRR